MKKLLIIMLLGLGLAACKKEAQSGSNTSEEKAIMINGKNYTVDYLRNEMAKNLGVESNSLIYHKEDTSFSSINYSETRFKVSKLFK